MEGKGFGRTVTMAVSALVVLVAVATDADAQSRWVTASVSVRGTRGNWRPRLPVQMPAASSASTPTTAPDKKMTNSENRHADGHGHYFPSSPVAWVPGIAIARYATGPKARQAE